MKKIITYVVLITFILSAVHCQVDAQKTPFPILPLLNAPDENFPLLEIPENQELHVHTEDQQQIRQNLIGLYGGQYDNQLVRIRIRDNYIFYRYLGHLECATYSVNFFIHGEPTITFYAFETIWNYAIVFNPDSPTNIVGLRSLSGNTELELSKIPDRQSQDLQEL